MTEKSLFEMLLPDPVLAGFDLPLRRTFFPFGFPLELATNSPEVIQAAGEGWGLFEKQFDVAPARLQVGVAGENTNPLPPNSTFRNREHLMLVVADADNFMTCDFYRNFGFAWITEPVARDHALVRYRFLIAGGLSLIEKNHLAPLHCGLIARNGRGVALLGDSFAGKSTLAYACARAGWTFVCDDGANLVRKRSDRYAVGDPYVLRLRPDATLLFPELEDRLRGTEATGKAGAEIFTRELPVRQAVGCSVDHLVFLNRNPSGPAHISHYSKDEILRWCERYVAFGPADLCEAQVRCYQRLLSAGIWEMRYSDLDDAIGRLESLVDSGA